MHTTHLHLRSDGVYPFDARSVAKRFRHASIFAALDALGPGEVMDFVNDHDPLPLITQLHERYGEGLEIRYVERDHGMVRIHFVRTPESPAPL